MAQQALHRVRGSAGRMGLSKPDRVAAFSEGIVYDALIEIGSAAMIDPRHAESCDCVYRVLRSRLNVRGESWGRLVSCEWISRFPRFVTGPECQIDCVVEDYRQPSGVAVIRRVTDGDIQPLPEGNLVTRDTAEPVVPVHHRGESCWSLCFASGSPTPPKIVDSWTGADRKFTDGEWGSMRSPQIGLAQRFSNPVSGSFDVRVRTSQPDRETDAPLRNPEVSREVRTVSRSPPDVAVAPVRLPRPVGRAQAPAGRDGFRE